MTDRQEDVITLVVEDHNTIKSLFAEVENAPSPEDKRDRFQDLVRTLAVHETSEEEVVHPYVRDSEFTMDELLSEENTAKHRLLELQKKGVEDPSFDTEFATFKQSVLNHATEEETHEHPLLRSSQDKETLRKLAAAYRAAAAVAPTRPHPHGPESAAGNMVAGPVVSIVDRIRDAARGAMQKSRS